MHVTYTLNSLKQCLELNDIYYDLLLRQIHDIAKHYHWDRQTIISLSGGERNTWWLLITTERDEILKNTKILGAMSTVLHMLG